MCIEEHHYHYDTKSNSFRELKVILTLILIHGHFSKNSLLTILNAGAQCHVLKLWIRSIKNQIYQLEKVQVLILRSTSTSGDTVCQLESVLLPLRRLIK